MFCDAFCARRTSFTKFAPSANFVSACARERVERARERERERERERQRERQTDRETERERERQACAGDPERRGGEIVRVRN